MNEMLQIIWDTRGYAPVAEERPYGVNFAICLSVWDWLFRTAYCPPPSESPTQQPGRLGIQGDERFPRSLLGRFFCPLTRLVARKSGSMSEPEQARRHSP